MMHIFELYEETFPEHASKSLLSSQATYNTDMKENEQSEMTTPTDIETPAKDQNEKQ